MSEQEQEQAHMQDTKADHTIVVRVSFGSVDSAIPEYTVVFASSNETLVPHAAAAAVTEVLLSLTRTWGMAPVEIVENGTLVYQAEGIQNLGAQQQQQPVASEESSDLPPKGSVLWN